MLELRASKIGGCPRAYVMDIRSGKEEKLTARQKLFLTVGKKLEPVIMEHAGYNPDMLFNDKVEVRIDIGNGVILTGHPDSADPDWVIECKTMRSVYFKEAQKNGIEAAFPQYLMQGSIYAKGLAKRGVKYLFLDKDASEIQIFQVEWSTLGPYYDKAVTRARKIAQWLPLTKLPGRPADLARWHCLPACCGYTDCRYHFGNPKNLAWKASRSGKVTAVPMAEGETLGLGEWQGDF